MVKLKATKKEMREHYWYILSVGYCEMQSLLNEQRPFAYSARAEGWACDYYKVDDILLSTGYAPLNNKNMKCDYSLIREYEHKALKIDELCLPREERKEKKEALLKEMLNSLKKPMKYEE